MKDTQSGKPESSAVKRVLKRRTNRKRRAAERREPETAPVRNRYRGYST